LKDLSIIIQQCLKGNESSQRALYEKFRVQWYMILQRYASNRTEADDMFQEGLINVFKNLKQFNSDKASFSTWSTRVMINAGITFLKKQSWAKSMGDVSEAYGLSTDEETVYEKIAAKELTHMVQRLPTGYRLVFNMYVVEGYSHKEIAQALGVSEGTSKSQLSKAKNKLREYLSVELTS